MIQMTGIRKKKSIPFLQLKNRQEKGLSRITHHRQYFEEMIQTVENNRRMIEGEIIKEKQKSKQISNYYYLRKKIIPSDLRKKELGERDQECEQKTNRIRCRQKTEKCIENNELKAKIRVKMYTEGIKSAGTRKGNLVQLDANRKQKWCLSLSEKQKNTLFYGKQLKIGKKMRQKYMSTEKLKKLRDDMYHRHKNRPIYGSLYIDKELDVSDNKEKIGVNCPSSAKSQKVMASAL